MPDNKLTIQTTEKIEKIYQIIEFEIGNANNQLALFKKDNMNFILLILALIGFFAFIPVDIFLYNWFGNGILMMIICSGCITGLSIAFFINFDKNNKINNPSEAEKEEANQKCDACDSWTICKNIEDEQKREKFQKTIDLVLIENVSLLYSAFYYTGFFFLITSFVSYLYLIYHDPSKSSSSLIQSDPIIVMLLFLALLAFLIIQQKHQDYLKKGIFKYYIMRQIILSAILLALGILIGGYGYFSKLPPFISITNTSQFSSILFEHSNIIPSFPLSLIVLLYTVIILIALLEYFFSSKYLERNNQKLMELLSLKYRIDRYQLGVTSEIDIVKIIKKLSKLKIIPPQFITIWSIINVPIPFQMGKCEDTLYLALEDSITDETEKV